MSGRGGDGPTERTRSKVYGNRRSTAVDGADGDGYAASSSRFGDAHRGDDVAELADDHTLDGVSQQLIERVHAISHQVPLCAHQLESPISRAVRRQQVDRIALAVDGPEAQLVVALEGPVDAFENQ